jgi:hypothetical protein
MKALTKIWQILSHEITIWVMLTGSGGALGTILARAMLQSGAIEQHTGGAGICLAVIAAAFAIGYIRDCSDVISEGGGDNIGDV